MRIRSASKNDIPLIQGLVHNIWPKVYSHIISEEQITYMLELMYSHEALSKQFDEGHLFLLAEEEDSPVGFAAFSKKSSTNYHLQKYVLTDFHNNGIGKSLMAYIINYVFKKGGNALELNVNRKNSALKFYQKLGFEIIRSEDIDIGNGWWMNDFVMKKSL